MKKNGFTLLELLAVIVIIGLIALITYPIIDDVITNSEKKTFKASVEELVNIAEVDYNEFGRTGVVMYTFNKENITCNVCKDKIKYNGEIEEGTGTIILNNGKLSNINITSKYYKAQLNDDKKIEITNKE